MSDFPGREVAGRSPRKRQALRTAVNGREKIRPLDDYLYPSEGFITVSNLSGNVFLRRETEHKLTGRKKVSAHEFIEE